METIPFFADIKPFVTVVHVLSVVFGMGAALMSDLLFTFYGKDRKLSSTEVSTLRVLSTVVWIGLVVITLSGAALFFSDVPKYLASVKFLVKMTIMVVLLINGSILHRHVSAQMALPHFLISRQFAATRRLAFACGAISVISWLSLCTLGVLDSVAVSYGTLMAVYLAVIVVGISVALGVEQSVFERTKSR